LSVGISAVEQARRNGIDVHERAIMRERRRRREMEE